MGIDLIYCLEGNDVKVYGLIILLLLKVDGIKFGKIVGGVVWLNFEWILLYEFY